MLRRVKYSLAIQTKHMSYSLTDTKLINTTAETSLISPWTHFRDLLSKACKFHGRHFTSTLALATSTPSGKPSVRIVLYKLTDDNRLVFFTNYYSKKGQELTANPQASATLFWPGAMAEITIEGEMKRCCQKNDPSRELRIL